MVVLLSEYNMILMPLTVISNKYIIKKNFLFFVSPVYIKFINENIKI